ncbi:hypothetical protein [Bradyrhizobium elkanii]|uniref:Uncharacterized protein n=1 Tax=Bradyrhizobium elkanii TaxID=29448 RepID=A0A8I1YCH0_BRAEL|nr:hypothetical protein [Bradyrhizobium elkanii]MBP1297463.1 hypothetical protein [Bradyrhizobium elkanii]
MAPNAGKNTIAALEAQAHAAQNELAAAESAFAGAVQSMEEPPLELSDDQIADLVDVKRLAEVRLVKARAAYRRAGHALTEARKVAAERERRDELARVHSMGSAAQKQLEDAVTTATKQLRAAMRSMAEAEVARETLNRKLPDDQQIPSFEVAIMDAPSIPRHEISRVRELHWLHPSGRPYDPEYAAKIKPNANGTAYISHGGHTTTLTKRAFFERTTYTDWIGARGVSSLAAVLALPGLKGAPAGWSPMRFVTPQSVLNELDRIESHNHVDPEPEIRSELVAVSPVFESVEEIRAWEVDHGDQPATEQAA